MIYSFCDLSYRIELPLEPSFIRRNPIYDVFRTDDKSGAHIIHIRLTDTLKIPDKKPVFQGIQGVTVVQEGKNEYRYCRDFYSGVVTAVMKDDHNSQTLELLRNGQQIGMGEMSLINHLAFERLMSREKRFVLHASFIETKKGAVLFTAPSGIGKSTQAELWHRYKNAEIINGDRAGIWKKDGVWMAGGVPWCGTSGIMKNKIIPLRAIVVLEQGTENTIGDIRLITKIGRVLEQLTVNPWNSEMTAEAKLFSTLLCQEIPVIQLSCRPDRGAVEVLETELEKNDGK